MPLVHEIQAALMRDLFISFLSAFGIIAVIMSIAQAGIWTGLIAMVPNFFPMVFMFGLLGWMGVALDIGSVMTASIALGIAIDDVLHFLTFYRRALRAVSAPRCRPYYVSAVRLRDVSKLTGLRPRADGVLFQQLFAGQPLRLDDADAADHCRSWRPRTIAGFGDWLRGKII